MNVWIPVLGGAGLLVSFVAAASLPALAWLPRLSAEWFRRLWPARAIAGVAGACVAAAAVALGPGAFTWTLFLLALLLASVSVVVWPQRVFVALGPLRHASVAEATLAGEAQVMAFDEEGAPPLAWPLEAMVVRHHLVNDVVGDVPVLVSWCHACRSGLLWDPVVDGRRLTFQVAGVYRRNLVMQDRETGSIWQQAAGEAIAGPLSGRRLVLLASQQVTWDAWQTLHDDAHLAIPPDPAPRGLLPPSRLTHALAVTNWLTLPGQQRSDDRLPEREDVIGVVVDGASCAFPLSALQSVGRVKQRVGSREIELTARPGTGFVQARDATTGDAVPYEKHWWLGWREFHPFTQVWTPADPDSGPRPHLA